MSSSAISAAQSPSLAVTPEPVDPRLAAVEEQIADLLRRIVDHHMEVDVERLNAEANRQYLLGLVVAGRVTLDEVRLGTREQTLRLMADQYRHACEGKVPRRPKKRQKTKTVA